MFAPQIATEKASVRIDGGAVDPCSVIAGLPTGLPSGHEIEIHIAAKVLMHELQQSGVDVSERTLRDFVAADAHDERGRDAYLTIARFIISPLPQQKFFFGVFRPRNPVRHALAPRWAWTDISDAQLRDNTIIFLGKASDV